MTHIVDVALGLLNSAAIGSDAEDFCRHLVIDLPLNGDVASASLHLLEQTGGFLTLGRWGNVDGSIEALAHEELIFRAVRFRAPVFIHLGRAEITLVGENSAQVLLIPGVVQGVCVGLCMLDMRQPEKTEEFELDLLQAGVDAFFVRHLSGRSSSLEARHRRRPEVFWTLTARQQEILRLLADGSTNPQIAKTLCVSESLVKQELVHVYKLIGVRNRVAAREFCLAATNPPPPRIRDCITRRKINRRSVKTRKNKWARTAKQSSPTG